MQQAAKRPERGADDQQEKLAYLLERYAPENVQQHLARLNKLPFAEVAAVIEHDLSVTAQMLVAFQENPLVQQQVEEIHTELGALALKKRREKDL